MALVEVTRFDDPQEGQIAASALSAAGIHAVCHVNGYGTLDFLMRRATQGYGLWVQADMVTDARAFLAERRTVNPEALAWRRHPQVLTGIQLAAATFLDPNIGLMIAATRQRPSPFRIAATLAVWVLAASVLLGAVLLTR